MSFGGTDPSVGAALAQSILEYLDSRKSTVLVTTHYDQLKALASDRKGFRNASMGFSSKDYRPTYEIVYDLQGRALALKLLKS